MKTLILQITLCGIAVGQLTPTFKPVGSNGENINSSPFIVALGGTTAGKALFQIVGNGTAGQVPQSNGSGGVTWATVSSNLTSGPVTSSGGVSAIAAGQITNAMLANLKLDAATGALTVTANTTFSITAAHRGLTILCNGNFSLNLPNPAGLDGMRIYHLAEAGVTTLTGSSVFSENGFDQETQITGAMGCCFIECRTGSWILIRGIKTVQAETLTGTVPFSSLVSTRTVGDANATITAGTRDVILTAALTAARTYTLPLASAYPSGSRISFSDSAITLTAANTATLACAGSNLINGQTSMILNTPGASPMLISDGTSRWTLDIRGVSRGGTGVTTLNGIVKGNGTAPMTPAVPGTDYVSPSGSGAALTALNADNLTTGRVAVDRLVNTQSFTGNGGTIANGTRDALITTAPSVSSTYVLPAATTANGYPAGARVTFTDMINCLTPSLTATLQPTSGGYINNVLNGTIVLSTAGASPMLISDGAGKWNLDIRGVARGGTGTTTGSITGTTALTFSAGGTNQNISLTPSGTGYVVLPAGSSSINPGTAFAGSIGAGGFSYLGNTIYMTLSGQNSIGFGYQNIAMSSPTTFGWNSNPNASQSSPDTLLSRKSVGITRFGTTTANSLGSWEATNGTLLGTLAVTGTSTLTGGIIGVTNGTNATAGNVGESVRSLIPAGSAVALTNATGKNVTSISLTAGDWIVTGNINFAGTSATYSGAIGGISTVTDTVPTDGTETYSGAMFTLLTATDGITLTRIPINVSTTTTVYLVGKPSFSAGTVAGFGSISARRIR